MGGFELAVRHTFHISNALFVCELSAIILVKIWQKLSPKKAELRIKKISHLGFGQEYCEMISSAISDRAKKKFQFYLSPLADKLTSFYLC